MQFTPRRTIGGHAWPSVNLGSPDLEKALVLWGNTTFGLMMHWWQSNKQQSGRGRFGVRSAGNVSVLNVKALPAVRLARAVEIFDALSVRELLPFNEIDGDASRREIDILFGRDVLGLKASILDPGGPLDILRMKLAREPSIHGGKKSRGRGK